MQTFICLFLPPVLMVFVWKKIRQETCINKIDLIYYIVSTLLLNFLCLGVLTFLFKNNENIFLKLNTYGDFAFKFLLLSISVSIFLPIIVHLFQKNVIVKIKMPDKIKEFKYWRLVGVCYALLLLSLHVIRLFNKNYWGDECFSILLSKMSFGEIINITASDVHPPLYYFILRLICLAVGDSYIGYNLTSLLPYAISLCFVMTVVWKRFGKECAFILSTMLSLMPTSIIYNLELRMYGWGSLFILLSFYFLYQILKTNRIPSYFGFVVFSVCAAYTHYYCLITVAFYYIVLLIMVLKDWKKYLIKVFISCAITVAAYLPWFFVLLKTVARTSNNFWLTEYPDFWNSTLYLFQNKYQEILLYIFIVTIILFFIKELKILHFTKSEDKQLTIHFNILNYMFTSETVWVFAGLLSVFGTIAVGIIVSDLIRPVYILRYIYPASVVVWLLLGFCISKLKIKKFLCVVVTALLLVSGLNSYKTTLKDELSRDTNLKSTLSAMSDVTEGDIIYTNHDHISWTVGKYYFNSASFYRLADNPLPTLDKNKTYWFILTYPMDNNLSNHLISQQYNYEQIVHNGELGTYNIYVYKVVAI